MHELKEPLLIFLAIVFLIVCVRATVNLVSEWHVKRRSAELSALDNEFATLCKEVSKLSPVLLTTEIVPQQFPSKAAAQSFGEKWSLGGAESFRVKALDNQNRDEDHPQFDHASVCGGILYSYPALFFGMKEAHQDDAEWFLGFARARNQWLKKYLAHLRNET